MQAVRAVEAVPLAERVGAGQHLLLEVRGAEAAARLREIERHAGAQRSVGDDEPPRRGLGEQGAIDEHRRHERLRVDRRQPEPVDERFFVEPLDLIAEREELGARQVAVTAGQPLLDELRGGEADVAAERDHVRHPPQRNLAADLLDDVGDVTLEQAELQLVAVALEVELLAQPHRAERVHARDLRFAAAEQRQVGAAAADLGEQCPCALERRLVADGVADREEDEPALLRFVDDLERNAGAATDAIEEHLGVARFAHRAGGDGADVLDAVLVDELAEAEHGGERRVHRLGANHAGGERVAAEQDAAAGFVDDPERLLGSDLGDDQSNRAGPHVEHGHEAGGDVPRSMRE